MRILHAPPLVSPPMEQRELDALFIVGMLLFGVFAFIWWALNEEKRSIRNEKRRLAMEFKLFTREEFVDVLDGRLRVHYAKQFIENRRVLMDWIEELVSSDAKIEECVKVQGRLRDFRPVIAYLSDVIQEKVYIVFDPVYDPHAGWTVNKDLVG
jgi:cbb3-type cytochrome oxidase subunit 3